MNNQNRGMGRSINDPRAAKNEKMDKARRSRVLSRILRYILRYKWAMLGALLLMLASNLLALAGPALSGKVINATDPFNAAEGGGIAIGKVDFDTVKLYCILLLIQLRAALKPLTLSDICFIIPAPQLVLELNNAWDFVSRNYKFPDLEDTEG